MTIQKNQHSVHVIAELIDAVVFGSSRIESDKNERDRLIEKVNALDNGIRNIGKNQVATIDAIAVLLLEMGFTDRPRTIMDIYDFLGETVKMDNDVDGALQRVLLKFLKP